MQNAQSGCLVCGSPKGSRRFYCSHACGRAAYDLGICPSRKAETLPVRPLRRWLRDYVIASGGIAAASKRLGYSERRLWSILRRQPRVTLAVADKILTAAGESPALLNELYPLKDDGQVAA